MLFDDPEPGRPPDPSPSPTYSVRELGALLTSVLRSAFPAEVWVRGEIQDLSRPHSGHVYFTLVDSEGGQRACLAVMLSASNKDRVNRELRHTGGAVRMSNGTDVRIRGRIDWYAGRGQLQLRMTAIDPAYTLGALELARAELVARLDAEGLLTANRQLPLPASPLRVGLVTSVGSAAEADVLDELRRSGFGFRVVVAGARVQGDGAPDSIARAIAALASRGVEVVAVVRGGGARTDLAAFDDEVVARAIANCPLPVLTGIGHEVDHAVADAVAHTAAKTPTACAQLLVERVRASADAMEERWAAIARAASGIINDRQHRLRSVADRTAMAARAALELGDGKLGATAQRARRGSVVALDRAEAGFDRSAGRATGAARQHLRAAQAATAQAGRLVRLRAPRALAAAERELAGVQARVRAHEPARALARGWSITRRLADGELVRAPADAPAGTELLTMVAAGELRSRVAPRLGDDA